MLLDCVQYGRRFGPEVKQALEAAILAGITRDRLPLYVSLGACSEFGSLFHFCFILELSYSLELILKYTSSVTWICPVHICI